MNILSLDYLVFTAVVFLCYYLFPLKRRWWVLLAASIVFYAFSGIGGLAYLGAVAGVTYGGALGIRALADRGSKALGKVMLAAVLTLVLGAMACLKYGSFWKAGPWIPLGLSWFSFQSAGYVIDVYRGKLAPEKNPCKYLLFVAFFPQMTQGPISPFSQLTPQLTEGHRLEPTQVTAGFTLMVWGFFKKLVIADRLAQVTAYVTASEGLPGWLAWASASVYMVQLYADFSGGMDVIRGTAQMLGINMVENFRRPFFARSVAEYWRRWHISLGVWFRSYLLYPITTSRLGLALGRGAVKWLGRQIGRLIPSALTTLLIFLLIGIWHGISWNAVLYGLYFGVVMVAGMLLEPGLRAMKKRTGFQDKHPALTPLHLIRTWLLLMPAQYFAFSQSAGQAFRLMGQTFSSWSFVGFSEIMTGIMPTLEWGIVLAALALLTVVDIVGERGPVVSQRLAEGHFLLRWVALIGLILAIVVWGRYGEGIGGASFLYTQF